jgi:hypothetical protein
VIIVLTHGWKTLLEEPLSTYGDYTLYEREMQASSSTMFGYVTGADVDVNKLLYVRSELLNDDRGVGSANVAWNAATETTTDHQMPLQNT